MSRIHIATRGIGDWRSRLADPERHWRRGFSAFELAACWQAAQRSGAGLPPCVAEAFRSSPFEGAKLLLAVAEHKVRLLGSGGASQCDLWGLLKTEGGQQVSLTVEGKGQEPFGAGNETLGRWLQGNNKAASQENRRARWAYVRDNLPERPDGAYAGVAFQLLHRCAAAVIEARRCDITAAAFLVQAFGSPDTSFAAFAALCDAIGVPAARGRVGMAAVGEVRLGVGWVDCPFATDAQVAGAA